MAVIGGGISGLAAAYRLIELDRYGQLTLLEAGPRLGGVIRSVHQDGFQVEQSADNFITTVPYGVDLCKQVGLEDQLIQTNPAHRRTYVVRRGRLYTLPDGFLMMAPSRWWPLATTPILSLRGKLRAACEYFIPPQKEEGDQSMAAFVRRRFGRETFDRLVEPLVSAVYAADMEKLSLEATLPRFRQMEREHGSLIRAMRREMKTRAKTKAESGARYSMFVTLRGGLSSLVEAIAARLPRHAVRLNAPVTRIERRGDGWRLSLGGSLATDNHLAPGESPGAKLPGAKLPAINSHLAPGESPGAKYEQFDAIIIATPSHAAAGLLRPVDADLAEQLGRIEHSGTAIVSVGYRRDQIAHPLSGMGVVIPAIENSPILACSFSSQKYAHRAPEGKELLRVFVGGARRPELAEADDRQLREMVLGELDRLLGISGEPCYCDVAHWPRTMPQYHVGHLELVSRIEARVAKIPNFELAGNAYHGVGIPICIHSGQQAAERVLGVAGGPAAD